MPKWSYTWAWVENAWEQQEIEIHLFQWVLILERQKRVFRSQSYIEYIEFQSIMCFWSAEFLLNNLLHASHGNSPLS